MLEALEDRRMLAITIDVGDHNLLPDTPNQRIEIRASAEASDLVTGFITQAQIGDGLGNVVEPVFSDLDYSATLWETGRVAGLDDFEILGGPITNAEMFVSGSIGFDGSNPNTTLSADGLVVTLIIDTSGISSGVFDLILSEFEVPAGSRGSDFVGAGGADVPATITDGTITVGTVAAPTIAIESDNSVQSEGDEGSKDFSFAVTRSGNTDGESTVQFRVEGSGDNAADATDFGGELPSGTVTFGPGETTKTVNVAVSGDLTVEQDEEFTVTLFDPTNAELDRRFAIGIA